MAPRQPMAAPAHSVALAEKTVNIQALIEEIAAKTPQRYDAGRFAPKSADELWDLARDWYWSGLLPSAYYPKQGDRYAKQWVDQGVAKAVVVMRYGASLGVLPEQAIRQIYIVEGQPSPSAALMISIAIASGVLRRDDWRIVEATRAKVVIDLFGATRGKGERVEAKYEDYKHLHHKDNWKNYPEDMLVARATSRAMRRYFPDMFAGVYAAEERADMRQDRAAGQIEDPVERILQMADAPTEPEQPPPARAEDEQAPDPLEEAARFAEEVKGLERRVMSAGVGELEGLREEIKALPDSAEKRGLVRAWQARSKELTVVATPAQSVEGGGA